MDKLYSRDQAKKCKANWRVFYTQARAEKRCKDRLERAGIQAFLPTYVAQKDWSDRKKRVVQPLFSNYIFAYVDEFERIEVLQTSGIAYCVKVGSQFASLSDEDIKQIQITQLDQEKIAQWVYKRPRPGEAVSVVQGPMKGLRGEVLRHKGASYVIVQLEAIRQAVRVVVPSEWIVRIPRSSINV